MGRSDKSLNKMFQKRPFLRRFRGRWKVMRFRKNLFPLLFLFLSFQIGLGQEKPKAELLDEFGSVTWDDFLARMDNLMSKLAGEPNSTAFIVIHNRKGTTKRGRFLYERYAKGHLKFRSHHAGEKRISVIRAEDRNELLVRLWVVPEGAERPSFTEVKWDLSLGPGAKPHVFTTTADTERAFAAYPEYLSLDFFSEYLEANPTARGHFVIREGSKERFRKEQAKITSILADKYKIDPKRLRFFYIRENRPEPGFYPDVEVWMVPGR